MRGKGRSKSGGLSRAEPHRAACHSEGPVPECRQERGANASGSDGTAWCSPGTKARAAPHPEAVNQSSRAVDGGRCRSGGDDTDSSSDGAP
jgi:hypothetical protein